MSQTNTTLGLRGARLASGALALLLVAACAGTTPKKVARAHDAAAYNVQLGIAYMNKGDIALAKDKLDRALAQDPDNADVHSARAMLFQRMGDPAKSDAEFRTALHLAPHDPEVVNNYAVYLCQNGRTNDGVRRFEEAARNALYRTPEAAYTNAGVCLRAAKRDEEARADFGRALRIKPNFAEAALQLTNLEFEHGELAPARAAIDAFIGSYDATADLLLLGVRVARAQGDKIGAQRYARRLQLDFPGSDQVRALAELDRNPG